MKKVNYSIFDVFNITPTHKLHTIYTNTNLITHTNPFKTKFIFPPRINSPFHPHHTLSTSGPHFERARPVCVRKSVLLLTYDEQVLSSGSLRVYGHVRGHFAGVRTRSGKFQLFQDHAALVRTGHL